MSSQSWTPGSMIPRERLFDSLRKRCSINDDCPGVMPGTVDWNLESV
jgi:hypothetical protein